MNFKKITAKIRAELTREYTVSSLIARIRSGLSRPKTVDGIVGSINKQVAELRNTAKAHHAAAAAAYAKADAMNDAGDAAVDEASRAARIAGNFERLLK